MATAARLHSHIAFTVVQSIQKVAEERDASVVKEGGVPQAGACVS